MTDAAADRVRRAEEYLVVTDPISPRDLIVRILARDVLAAEAERAALAERVRQLELRLSVYADEHIWSQGRGVHDGTSYTYWIWHGMSHEHPSTIARGAFDAAQPAGEAAP